MFFLLARVLTHSRIGTVLKAIRDNDVRAEFMGYNVANYRIFVFCVSAFMAATAGAMYAAWVGIVSFLDTGPLFSVEAVIWTAVGGRATLIGPFLGAFLVSGLEFLLSGSWFANYWQLFMGALFIAVVLWIPDGIVGSIGQLAAQVRGGARCRRFARSRIASASDRQRDWEPAGAAETRRASAVWMRERDRGVDGTPRSSPGLTTTVSGYTILNNLDFSVDENELRVLLGPNGAGKTTLIAMITGQFKPTSGKIVFDGQDITGKSPDEIFRAGISRKFQVPNMYETLSVYDNVMISLHGDRKVFKYIFKRVTPRRERAHLGDPRIRRARRQGQ